jgi:hypothetical protein
MIMILDFQLELHVVLLLFLDLILKDSIIDAAAGPFLHVLDPKIDNHVTAVRIQYKWSLDRALAGSTAADVESAPSGLNATCRLLQKNWPPNRPSPK